MNLASLRKYCAVAASRNSFCSTRASQLKAPRPQNAFWVGEQHLDSLTVAARLIEGNGVA